MKPGFIEQVLIGSFLAFISLSAMAGRLEVHPESHILWHLGANLILYIHIVGGAIGLLAGVVASFSPKGAFLHRRSGRVFLWSMLACYGVGAVVAPFLAEGQRPNLIAAILALYLLASGVQAANKRTYTFGLFNKVGLVISLFITSLGLLFIAMGAQSKTGSVDGSPPEAFVVFVIAGGLAAIGEVRLLIIKQLSPEGRLYRHLWRMCFSFFIASGSLFFGQISLFPAWFSASPLPGLLAALPLFLLMYWTLKLLLQRYKKYRSQKFAGSVT